MLVTFHSKAWSSITMFGDVAGRLLHMAGHSGTIPSALLAREIPAALAQLKSGLDAAEPNVTGAPAIPAQVRGDDAQTLVGIRLRALPLIQMLAAAAAQGHDVMWEHGAPAV